MKMIEDSSASANVVLTPILALDLGKFKSVACVLNRSDGTHRFETIATNPASIHDLLAEIKPSRLVIEACSIAGWVGVIKGSRPELSLPPFLLHVLRVTTDNHQAHLL